MKTFNLVVVVTMAFAVFSACRSVASDPIHSPTIEFRRAWMGVVEDCSECIIVAFKSGKSRAAYFVHSEPICELRADHIAKAFADEEKKQVVLELSNDGMNLMQNCFSKVGYQLDHVVLVSVTGLAVGRAMFYEDFGLAAIEGGDDFSELRKLFPNSE